MADLTSAPLPPVSEAEDHVRGPAGAPLVVLYAEFTCPRCAVAARRLEAAPLRVAFRHFALRARTPRAPVLAAAAEAAALQGAFWPFHDALFADQGRQDDPHLWVLAGRLGLDVDRFEADRRGDAAPTRVRAQVAAAMRGGVVVAPTLVAGGALRPGVPEEDDVARLATLR